MGSKQYIHVETGEVIHSINSPLSLLWRSSWARAVGLRCSLRPVWSFWRAVASWYFWHQLASFHSEWDKEKQVTSAIIDHKIRCVVVKGREVQTSAEVLTLEVCSFWLSTESYSFTICRRIDNHVKPLILTYSSSLKQTQLEGVKRNKFLNPLQIWMGSSMSYATSLNNLRKPVEWLLTNSGYKQKQKPPWRSDDVLQSCFRISETEFNNHNNRTTAFSFPGLKTITTAVWHQGEAKLKTTEFLWSDKHYTQHMLHITHSFTLGFTLEDIFKQVDSFC